MGLSVYFKDVTAHIEYERQLNQHQARLNGILNSQVDFVSRYLPDTTLTYVNDAYCDYIGLSREDLLDKPFLNMAGVIEHERIRERIQEVLQNPAPDVRIIRSRHSDGTIRWIQWVDSGIVDETGEVVEIQAVGRDITPLITTRQQLEHQKELLQMIFDHIPVMVCLFDDSMQFTLVNRYWVEKLGWTLEEIQQYTNPIAVFYPDPAIRQEVLDFMISATPGWRDFETVTKDGGILQTTWSNVRLSDGQTIGIGQDITVRKELENQRLDAQQLRGELEKERELINFREQFVSMVTHEFRNPLAVIQSSVELLNRYFDRMSEDRIREKFESVLRQVQSMLALMEDVLLISRNNAGKTEFEPHHFDVMTFCELLMETAAILDENEHALVFAPADDLPEMIYADMALLEHVFINLFSNAMKYSPEDTTITFTARIDSDTWQFSVRDEGMGIPPEELASLFEAFHRAKNVRDIPGTGLGLAIVKRYVDLHAGDIEFESSEAGGTLVTVYLPRIVPFNETEDSMSRDV